MRLQLVGIGALLGSEDDVCVIKELIAGGPADLGKQLRPNDKIMAVAQDTGEPVEVTGMKLRKIVDMIRGKKGTKVRLTIKPAAATDPSERTQIHIIRDVVNLNSARARASIYEVPGANGKTSPIGVITLPAFYGPDGGSDEKPVGTVFIGYAGPKGVRSIRFILPGDRHLVRWRASQAALDYLRRRLLKSEPPA